MMTLNRATKLLEKEYENAKKLEFVQNPMAYALHKVWQKADRETCKFTGKLIESEVQENECNRA